MKIKAILEQLKREKGLTNKDIASALGYEETTVQKWVAEKNCIGLKDLETLCQLYNIEPNSFFDTEYANRISTRDFKRLDDDSIDTTEDLYSLVDTIIGYDPKSSDHIMKYGKNY